MKIVQSKHDFTFCPRLEKLFLEKEVRSTTGKSWHIGGVSTQNNLVAIRNVMLGLKPAKTLEVGLLFGGSAMVFAASHRDLGRAGEGQHIAIDPFQTTTWESVGLANLKEANLSSYVRHINDTSALSLPRLVEGGHSINLAYIDGSHLFEDVFVDFYFIGKLLEVGGTVMFDDSSDPHIRKVLRFVKTNFRKTFAPFDLNPYRVNQGRSFKYQLAGLLGKRQLLAFQKVGPSERSWDSRFHNF